MKIKFILLPSVLILASTAFLIFTHQERVFGQASQAQVERRKVPNRGALSQMRADDTTVAKVMPRPDLTIKKMCIVHEPIEGTSGWDWLHVLVANIGSSDAGLFEVGIIYTDKNGSEIRDIASTTRLKAGEEQWIRTSPICCGWAPINPLVTISVKFQAIADPKYYAWNGNGSEYDEKNYSWVMPRILESNEKNNELTINRAELKICDTVGTQHPTQPPLVRPKKP